MKSFALATMAAAFAVQLLPGAAVAGVKEGVDAWQAGDYAKALGEWRGPAQAGDADAQFNLAQAYKLGRGVPTDLKLAQHWYQKAADQGHEQAQANLGLILFQNGDRKGALPWIQKAADRGEPRAQYVLGTALFNGDLVPRDWPKAYALMTRAAATGLPQAATSLSQMDRYIPLAQRQQGIAMAKSMDNAAAPSRPAPAVKPVAIPPSTIAAPAKPVATAAAAPAAKPAAPAPKPAASAKKPADSALQSAAPGNGWRVQLGAFGTEAAARGAWSAVSARVAALKGLQPYIVKVGTVSRLQAGPLPSRSAADRACQSASSAGTPCFVVKS